MGTILRGWTMTENNESLGWDSANAQGLTAFQAMGAEIMRPYYLALLAEAHGKLGQGKEALTLMAEAQDDDGTTAASAGGRRNSTGLEAN